LSSADFDITGRGRYRGGQDEPGFHGVDRDRPNPAGARWRSPAARRCGPGRSTTGAAGRSRHGRSR
jgi:hypothetical protein